MRILLQRVARARVDVVEDQTRRRVAGIGLGLLALVGFAPDDDADGLTWAAGKIADLRLFPGSGGGFDRSLRDTGAELLIVSQFTLYGDARKGRRPNFTAAAPYAEAERLYDRFREICEKTLPGRVVSGVFGARMEVALVNDGPVTLWLER